VLDFWHPTFEGRSGERWVVDLRTDVPEAPSRGRFHYGWAEGEPGTRVWVQRITLRDARDREDWEHLEHAHSLASWPNVQECPFIRRTLDIVENADDRYLISEYAEHRLVAVVKGAVAAPTANVIANISAALDVLHAEGLVHGDVHPENVLSVRNVWKLADLGSATKIGDPLQTQPPAIYGSFFPEGIGVGCPATPAVDECGVAELARYVAGLWHSEQRR